MLQQFQVNNKGTQLYVHMYPFSPKLPSHPGCHMTLSRIQQTGVFKYPLGVTSFSSCRSRQGVQPWLAQAEWWVRSLDRHFDFSQEGPKVASMWLSMDQGVLWVRLGLGPSRDPSPLLAPLPLWFPQDWEPQAPRDTVPSFWFGPKRTCLLI